MASPLPGATTGAVISGMASAPGMIEGLFSNPLAAAGVGITAGTVATTALTAIGVTLTAPVSGLIIAGTALTAGAVGLAGSMGKANETVQQSVAQLGAYSKKPYDAYKYEDINKDVKIKYTKDVENDFQNIFRTVNKYQKDMGQDKALKFSEELATITKSFDDVDMGQALAHGIINLGESAEETVENMKKLKSVALENDLDFQALWESTVQLQESTRLMGGDFLDSAKSLLYFENAMKSTRAGMRLTKDDALELAKSISDVLNSGEASTLQQRAVRAMVMQKGFSKLPTAVQEGMNAGLAEIAPMFPKDLMRNGKPLRVEQLSTAQLAMALPYIKDKALTNAAWLGTAENYGAWTNGRLTDTIAYQKMTGDTDVNFRRMKMGYDAGGTPNATVGVNDLMLNNIERNKELSQAGWSSRTLATTMAAPGSWKRAVYNPIGTTDLTQPGGRRKTMEEEMQGATKGGEPVRVEVFITPKNGAGDIWDFFVGGQGSTYQP